MKAWESLTAAIAAAIATTAATAVLAFTPAVSAHAEAARPHTARGCNVLIFPPWPKAGACIYVTGAGDYVDQVKGGINARLLDTVTGYFKLYDTDPDAHLIITTELLTCHPTAAHPGACYENRWHNVYRTMPVGSRICALLVVGHAQYGPACKTIEAPYLRLPYLETGVSKGNE